MRSKRVLRYYCDHCKKSGCGKSAMQKHENRCVKNPKRVCGFCRIMEQEQYPIERLIKAVNEGPELSAILNLTNHCPGCTLAAIVQGKFNEMNDGEPPLNYINFDFKAAVKQFWIDHEIAS